MKRLFVQTAPLGDFLLAAPALQCWIDAGPPGAVQLIVRPGLEGLARCIENVGPVSTLEKRWRRGGWTDLRRLRKTIREYAPRAVIAAQRSHRTAWLIRGAKEARRIGFVSAPGRWAYTDPVTIPKGISVRERYMRLVAASGVETGSADAQRVRLRLPEELCAQVAQRLAEQRSDPSRPLVAIAPGAAWETKRWLPERFGQLAEALIDHGADIVWVGSAAEKPLSQHSKLPAGHSLDWIGQTSLVELAATLRQVTQFVGNDSGTGHLANVQGVPTVTLFGPTSASMGYAPSGARAVVVEHPSLDCRPCHRHGPRRCPLGHFRCMRELDVRQVLDAIQTP